MTEEILRYIEEQSVIMSGHWVPDLIAEVRRLRAENERLRREIEDREDAEFNRAVFDSEREERG